MAQTTTAGLARRRAGSREVVTKRRGVEAVWTQTRAEAVAQTTAVLARRRAEAGSKEEAERQRTS